MLVDTHCHLYFDAFDADRAAVIARMEEAGVVAAVIAAIDAASSEQGRRLAAEHPQLAYAAGLHPTSEFPPELFGSGGFDARALLAPFLAAEPPPVAIGECGMDLHWDTNPAERQLPVFRAQLELGRELGLPVIVHSRDADRETLEALQSVPGVNAILHCFNGSPLLLDYALAAGLYVSFAGNLTYPKAHELRQAAAQVPLELLLVETDAPFLAPQARRGKRCEPADVVLTALELARIRGLEPAAMQALLLSNSARCFKRDWTKTG